MSDTITVRAPCKHGHYEAHFIWDAEAGRKKPGGCPGGREIVLRMRTFRAPVEGAGFPRWLESEWEWSDSPWEEQNG